MVWHRIKSYVMFVLFMLKTLTVVHIFSFLTIVWTISRRITHLMHTDCHWTISQCLYHYNSYILHIAYYTITLHYKLYINHFLQHIYVYTTCVCTCIIVHTGIVYTCFFLYIKKCINNPTCVLYEFNVTCHMYVFLIFFCCR